MKSLAASPKRLQRIWQKLQRYDIDLVIRTSSQMLMADTLSRAFPPSAVEGTVFSDELAALSTADADQMKELKMVTSSDTIAIINNAAAPDDEYVGLIAQIVRGWPDNAANVATYLRPYCTFADELSVSCGLIFKGHRLVVPQAVRAYLLEKLHAAHTGVNACQRRVARLFTGPELLLQLNERWIPVPSALVINIQCRKNR
jgi:hypothetical protein